MATKNNNYPPVAQKPLSPQIIEKLIDLQEKDLEHKARELDYQRQDAEQNYRYAQSSLDALSKDRELERQHQTRRNKGFYIFIGFLVMLLFIFLFATTYIGKDAIAIKIIELLLAFLCGGGGGYAVAKTSNKQSSQNTDE